jgi:hypothetical protein
MLVGNKAYPGGERLQRGNDVSLEQRADLHRHRPWLAVAENPRVDRGSGGWKGGATSPKASTLSASLALTTG